MANITDSLNQLKNTIEGSNSAVTNFRQVNAEFKKTLLQKIQDILAQIQGLANNPNIQNIRATQQQLTDTQTQLADSQSQLEAANTQLNQTQQQITSLEKDKVTLEDKLKQTNDDNGKIAQQLEDCKNQLKSAQQSQEGIIQNIVQVNGVLAQQVQNINEMLNDSNGFNEEYTQQIDTIATNLQSVVNLLNGSNPPTNPPTRGLNPNAVPFVPSSLPGGSRKRRRNKCGKTSKKCKKGGYNWSSRVSSASNGSSTKRKTQKRKQKVSNASKASL